jgi:hypothetical protein
MLRPRDLASVPYPSLPGYAFLGQCWWEAPVGTEPATAAADRGHLPPAQADREYAIETLKAAFVQDRLAKDEFEARLERALASRTRAELSAVIADLPGWLAVPRTPPPARQRSRVSMNAAVTGTACLIVVADVSMLFAIMAGSAAGIVLVAVLTVIGAAIAIGAMIVAP